MGGILACPRPDSQAISLKQKKKGKERGLEMPRYGGKNIKGEKEKEGQKVSKCRFKWEEISVH